MIEIILTTLVALIFVFIILVIGVFIMSMSQIDEVDDEEHYPFV